jgi:hypothetical protein
MDFFFFFGTIFQLLVVAIYCAGAIFQLLVLAILAIFWRIGCWIFFQLLVVAIFWRRRCFSASGLSNFWQFFGNRKNP